MVKKSELAGLLYHVLTDYNDLIQFQLKKKHPRYDFSSLDQPEKSVLQPNQEPIRSAQKNKPVINQSPDNKNKRQKMVEIGQKILNCTACNLRQHSLQPIPGAGSVNTQILVITYPVSSEEEKAGRPLVAQQGDFFKKWMAAIDIEIDDLFLTNILKCAPKNRMIQKEHIEHCRSHLNQQIEIIRPRIIVALGQSTLSALKKQFIDLNLYHGTLDSYQDIPFIPTFHPYDVLKNPYLKKAVWEDLKKIKAFLNQSG